MKINQRFRSRKDLHCYMVYFENEGPLEMSRVSASIMEQLREEKTMDELIQFIREKYPRRNAELEVGNVVETLQHLDLLS